MLCNSAGIAVLSDKETIALDRFTHIEFADKKSAPNMGLVTSARRKLHWKQWFFKERGIFLLPQEGIDCPPAEVRELEVGGLEER